MKFSGKSVVVTGAASGIGRALAARARAEGARGVVLADLPGTKLLEAASEVGGIACPCDVADEAQVKALIVRAEQAYGEVDIYFSNAGIYRSGGEESSDANWALNWNVHVMAHVYAARDLMPKMAKRGEGYFIITSSAAGLMTHIDSATYAVSKHAAVAFAEYLSVTYGPAVRISVLAPQAVRTPMTDGMELTVSSVDGKIETSELCDCVVRTMAEEKFLILPHPVVAEYLKRKTGDYDRWLAGMRKLKTRVLREV